MLRPTPTEHAIPIRRDKVSIDGRIHVIVSTIDRLEGIGFGFNSEVDYPATEGWATTEAEGRRFAAWYRSPR